MTNGIVASPPVPPIQYQQTERLQESVSYRAESYDVAYTDENGRSFRLSLQTETTTYSATYDRTAQVRVGPERGRQVPQHELRHEIREDLKELREDLKELDKAFKDAGLEVKGFKRLIHSMLKDVDRGYREHFRRNDPVEQEFAAMEQVQVEVAAVEQKMVLAMDDVDPVYWSAENTAQRLVDFAVGLYQGGDREDHVAKMMQSMERGYQEAAQAFGGALPEIARETVDLARELLLEWMETREVPELEEELDLVA